MADEVKLQDILGQPGFSELLMRALRMRGELPRLLAPVYQLGFNFADFQDDEWQWLRRSILYEAGASQAGVAAQLSIFAFATRQGLASSGRNVIARLDSFTVTNDSAAALAVGWALVFTGTGIADPTQNAYVRDDRGPTQLTASYFGPSNGTNAVSPASGGNPQVTLPVGQSLRVEGPWVLTNRELTTFRSALVVWGGTVNSSMRCTFKWREREILDTEL